MEPSRKELASLARAIAETAPSELDCDAILDRLAPFVEESRQSAALQEDLLAVKQHLKVCPECLEEYEALEDLVRSRSF